MTQAERIEDLIARVRGNAEAHGTSVRCPVCNAGIGKFCRVDMSDKGRTSRVITHDERVALQNAR